MIPKKNQLKSTNLSHLDALLHTAETFDHVTAVLRPVHYETEEGYDISLLVDVVGHKGRSWVKVTARKAEALHRIWEGECVHCVRWMEKSVESVETRLLKPHCTTCSYLLPLYRKQWLSGAR